MLNEWSRRRAAACVTLLLGATLAGCAVHWPWTQPAPRPPPAVHELTIESVAGPEAAAAAPQSQVSPIVQHWDRNALLLDLSAVQGAGTATLSPAAARGWPIRLELRVRPGAIASLEVEGSSRVVFEIPAAGAPLLLHLEPDVYRPGTAHITLRWRAAADSAH